MRAVHAPTLRAHYSLLSPLPPAPTTGELFTHLRKAGKFNNDHTRFYAAQIVMALQVRPLALSGWG
eukprot:scaffold129150_cov36-Phaeocystis_antarctica.AAC.1